MPGLGLRGPGRGARPWVDPQLIPGTWPPAGVEGTVKQLNRSKARPQRPLALTRAPQRAALRHVAAPSLLPPSRMKPSAPEVPAPQPSPETADVREQTRPEGLGVRVGLRHPRSTTQARTPNSVLRSDGDGLLAVSMPPALSLRPSATPQGPVPPRLRCTGFGSLRSPWRSAVPTVHTRSRGAHIALRS